MSRAESVGFDLDIWGTSDAEEADTPSPGADARPRAGADSGLAVLVIASGSGAADTVSVLLEQAFEDRCRVEHAGSAVAGADIMQRREHDICIFVEDEDADDVIGFVRSSAETAQRPVIILASSADSQLDLRAVDAGAADCIPTDDLTADTLKRSIRHALMREHVAARAHRDIEALSVEIGKLNTLRDANHRFVDNACHDFRSPLTVIKEFSSIIAEGLAGEVNEEQAEFLQIILTRVDQLSQMVDAILDASRLESDLINVKREEQAAEDIIAQVRPTLEQQANRAGVTLDFAVAPGLPNVFADMESAGRIITNLGVNACKFAGEGGLVQVWARRNEDGNSISIGVTDDGPGIAQEHVKLIFERFKQIKNDNETEKAGIGLGLHIASELARVNYGTLSVESKPDAGSTFAFTLPTFDVDRLIPLHLNLINTSRHGFQNICIIVMAAYGDIDAETRTEVERFLNRQLRSYDLLLQLKSSSWLACVACNDKDVSVITDRIRLAYAEFNRNRPHGVLPEISFRAIGSWPLGGQHDGLSEAIRSAYALGNQSSVH